MGTVLTFVLVILGAMCVGVTIAFTWFVLEHLSVMQNHIDEHDKAISKMFAQNMFIQKCNDQHAGTIAKIEKYLRSTSRIQNNTGAVVSMNPTQKTGKEDNADSR